MNEPQRILHSEHAKVAGYAGGRSSSFSVRNEYDEYATPRCAVEALLKHEAFEGKILEPACGKKGFITRVLEYEGFEVESSDLQPQEVVKYGIGGVDFLKRTDRVDNVITNPPFRLAAEFIRKCSEVVEYKAALMLRVGFLEGIVRYQLFQDVRPARILLMCRRLPYQTPKGEWVAKSGNFSHAWIVWDFSKRVRKTEFRHIVNSNKEIYPL